MKLNRLETHDRYEHFIQDQSQTIWQGADDCLNRNPDSLKLQEKSHYIYLYAHPRAHDDGIHTRLLWQPRLTKPKAQTNSYLFRSKTFSDIVEICWLIPPREMWPQYQKGNICESDWTAWSIDQFLNNRAELEKSFTDDWSDEQAANILKAIMEESIATKSTTQVNEGAFSFL